MTRFRKAAAVINARSGSTVDITAELRRKLSAVSDQIGLIAYAEPDKLDAVVENALNEACDVIIVFGGDGTICSVAMQAAEKNVPIIPLPGGTMNLFSKALYNSDDWQTALDRALASPKPRWAAAGAIDDDIFLCGCIIGTPTRLNEVREQVRNRNLLKAAEDFIFNAMDFDTNESFTYSLGQNQLHSRHANLLNILCPLVSDHDTGSGAFEINAINVGSMLDIASLGLSALASDWRENDSANTNLSDSVHIIADGPIDILLDGEPKRMESDFTVKLIRKGVRVFAP